jgi:acetyltransferase-like isoleucine patch superfamily enzyme
MVDYVNATAGTLTLDDVRMKPGAAVYSSTFAGPVLLHNNTRIGPDTRMGRYCSIAESAQVLRSDVGSFCAFGARVAVNPFNHPTDWLSINEFQYRDDTFDWSAEYVALRRLKRGPEMFARCVIGNDVWLGHNVVVLAGVRIGDGAVIGAGAVVTKDIPDYAVAVGNPAVVKHYRFPAETVARLQRVKWWDMPLPALSALPFHDIDRCLHHLEQMRSAA